MIPLANSNEPARGPGNWLRLVRSAGRDAPELDFKRVLDLLRGRVNEFASSIKNEEEPNNFRSYNGHPPESDFPSRATNRAS
jgi:hypothetical protein